MTGAGNESASVLAHTGNRPGVLAGAGFSPTAGVSLGAERRRPVDHRMGRRCFRWDYKGRGVYLVTIAAARRGRGIWGRVVAAGAGNESASVLAHTGNRPGELAGAGFSPTAGVSLGAGISPAVCVSPLAAKFLPNEIGQIIAREWLRLAEAWPGVRLLAYQVMEDHFHGVIATPSFMKKPLGAIIGSLKARVSSAVGASIWAEGYVDTILFDDEGVEKAVRYVRENPWRHAGRRRRPPRRRSGERGGAMSWPKARLGDVGIHGDPMEVALGFYAQNKVRRIVLNCESAAMLGSGGN